MDFDFSNYSIAEQAQPEDAYDSAYDPLSISPTEGVRDVAVKTEAEEEEVEIDGGREGGGEQLPPQYRPNRHRGSVPSLSSAFSSFTVEQQSPVTPTSGYFGHPFVGLSNANRHSVSVVAPSDTFVKPAAVVPPPAPQAWQSRRYNGEEDRRLNERLTITIKNFVNAPHRLDFGEQIVSITTPQTAQKSYGTEKRFIAPPPQVCLIGKNWNSDNKKNKYSHALGLDLGQLSPSVQIKLSANHEAHRCELKWTEFQSESSAGAEMPLTPPTSSPSSDKSDSLPHDSNDRLMHGKAVAKHLHISDVSDDRRISNCYAEIVIPSILSRNPFKGSFSLPNMNIISKASKQRKPKRNEDICVFHGSIVSLYNRAKSQTSSTRYLTVTGTPCIWPVGSDDEKNFDGGIDLKNATFTPDPNYWDPFIIWMYDTVYAHDTLPEVPADWPTPPVGAVPNDMHTTPIRANSVIVLQSLAHGVVSPPLIVRRAGKGSSVTGGGKVDEHRRRSSLDSNTQQRHRQMGCIRGSVLGEPTVQLNKVGLELAVQSPRDANELEASGMYLTCVDDLIRLIHPPKASSGKVDFPSRDQEASKSRRTSYTSEMHDDSADGAYRPRSRRASARSSISEPSGTASGRSKRRSSQYDANNLDAYAEDGMTWSLDVGEIALWTLSGAEVRNHHIYTPEFPSSGVEHLSTNRRPSMELPTPIPYLDSWVRCDRSTRKQYADFAELDLVRIKGKDLDSFSDIAGGVSGAAAALYFSGKMVKYQGVGLGLDLGDDANASAIHSNRSEEVGVWQATLIDVLSYEEMIVGLPFAQQVHQLGELIDDELSVIAIMKHNGCIIPSRVKVPA